MLCQCSFNICPISAASKVMKVNMSQRSENEVVKFIVVVVVVNESPYRHSSNNNNNLQIF